MADMALILKRHRKMVERAMCGALLLGLVLGAAWPAQAQGRPDSLKMTCNAVQAMVSTRGAVVVGSGPDIYDRFVASRAFCLPDEMTDPAWLSTADQRQCMIGYRCKRVDYDFER